MIYDSARVQDDAAVRRPPQKLGANQRIDDTLIRGLIQAEQAGRLGWRQPKSGHFVEFGSDTPHQLLKVHHALHSTASYSRRNSDTEGKSRATTGRPVVSAFPADFDSIGVFILLGSGTILVGTPGEPVHKYLDGRQTSQCDLTGGVCHVAKERHALTAHGVDTNTIRASQPELVTAIPRLSR
jgi:hypothetical protein